MSETDPIDALAVGVAADHKAKKGRGGKKAAQEAAATAGAEASSEAADAGSTAEEAAALGEVVEEKVEEALAAENEEPPVADAPQPTPAAPGDDRESVFDRRLARLTRLVEEAQFDSGTAFGDLRDLVLDLFKHRPNLWSAMIPSEQRDLIRHVESVVKKALAKVVLVIAQEDALTVEGTLLPGFTVKGETIEAKIKIEHADSESVLDVYRLAGHKVVVLSADDKGHSSTRRDVDPGDDQTEMKFADAPPKAAEPEPVKALPPADDSDLAGEDDEVDEEVGDEETAEDDVEEEVEEAPPVEAVESAPAVTGDSWGVFDTERSEWLIDEKGGDDGWTENRADAGRWAHRDAKSLAEEFAGDSDTVVARQLDEPAES